MKIFGKELTFNGNKVYHAGNKPTASEIGAAASSHTHNYAGSSSAGGAANSALTATKATQDSAGQQINTTYIKGLSVSGKTITYTKGDGTTGTITTQDTNTTYSTGTASTSGLTKLYTGTGTATDGTMTQAAINTALSGKAASSHTHNYAGSSSAGGAANSANTLSTARTINGTSFNGSTNITTANWGTARNIQIGNTSKSVNGSANVTWSLNEIGAAAASHGRHILDACETITDWNNATKNGWYMGNNATNSPTANAWYFGEVIAHNINYVVQTVYQFTASTDAKAMPKYIRAKMNGTWGAWTNVTVSKAVPSNAVFTDTNTWRGVQDNLTSTATDQSLSANQGKILKSLIDGKAASSHTHNYAGSSSAGGAANSANTLTTARTINGTSFNGSANITTANWGTARTMTIGNTGKSVNGSGNVSWSLSEIGAAAASHSHSYLPLSGGTITGSLTIGDAVLSPYSYSAAKGLSISAIQVKLQGSYGINLNSNTAIAGTLDMTSNMTMGGTKFYIKSGTNYSASYFPQLTGSNIYNPFAQIILETDNSAGRFHFLNANGQPGICFSGGFTVKTALAAYSTANLSNNKENAFDIINNFNIIEQNDSRVIVPNIQTCSNLNEDDNIETNYSKIEINNDGDAIVTTNLNSMVALLIDCVKELKSEIDSLKENLPNSL